ncbi:MAG: glycosyltransferase family 2 protein [Planctomycetota bacterium]|jgi:glycosyltransferase involved in cell wall biosynthesis|nr:glycosyltransferase family 2 protein [Planctomycetota bacterium]
MNTTAQTSLSVVMPAYNEEATISTVLGKVLALEMVTELLVVDDGSHDRTAELVEACPDPRCRLIKQERNGGKTAAVARGIKEAKGDVIIIQDADLEYDPAEIPAVVDPIMLDQADVVYGSRFLVRRAARVLYYYHYLANKFLTCLSNVLTNHNMTDIETCYKAFRAPVIKAMPFTSSGFGMEVEITAMITSLPLRIFEVPISYYGRTYDEGKKIGMRDGLAAIWYILYYNLIVKRTRVGRTYRKAVQSGMQAASAGSDA